MRRSIHPLPPQRSDRGDRTFGGWSPDGRYLAFARVSWIEQGGNWYWTAAYLDALDRATGAAARLSSQGLDWMPDWQATETLPPSSSVETLPGVSPSPIEVHWSGTDDGPAGLRSFDVQVREGPGGEWVNWAGGGRTVTWIYRPVYRRIALDQALPEPKPPVEGEEKKDEKPSLPEAQAIEIVLSLPRAKPQGTVAYANARIVVGLGLLVMLMIFAFYNDLTRVVSGDWGF